MGFKRGIFIVSITFASITLLTLFGNFLFFRVIGSNVKTLSVATTNAKGLTKVVISCNANLARAAREYLTNLKDSSLETLKNESEQCKTLVDQQGAPENKFKEWKTLIDRTVTTTAQLAARKKSIKLSLTSSKNQIDGIVKNFGSKPAIAQIQNRLHYVQSEINDALIDLRPAHLEKIKENEYSVRLIINSKIRPLRVDEAESLEDILVNLTAARSIWNSFVRQAEDQFKPLQAEFGEEGSTIVTEELQKLSEKGNRGFKILNRIGVMIAVIALISLGIFASISKLILRSWVETTSHFKQVCEGIINNDYSVIEKMNLENQNRETEARRSHDELQIAFQAISQMLTELASLKRGLEEKVEERTRKLKETQAQLIQSEKLAGLGTMAAGVAHELNNPLQVIMGMTERVMLGKSLEEKEKKALEKILSSSQRMSKIIEQLKRLARKSQENDRVWTPVSVILENSVTLARQRMQIEGVQYTEQVSAPCLIDCSPTQIESVLSNLYVNSLDAIQGTGVNDEYIASKLGTNTAGVSVAKSRYHEIRVETFLSAEGDLIIRVSDTGPGIPESLRKKVFEPFFTTKDTNKGTGLGLALCNQIVAQHEGTIQIQCPSVHFGNRGTTFTIRFPSAMVKPVETTEEGAAA